MLLRLALSVIHHIDVLISIISGCNYLPVHQIEDLGPLLAWTEVTHWTPVTLRILGTLWIHGTLWIYGCFGRGYALAVQKLACLCFIDVKLTTSCALFSFIAELEGRLSKYGAFESNVIFFLKRNVMAPFSNYFKNTAPKQDFPQHKTTYRFLTTSTLYATRSAGHIRNSSHLFCKNNRVWTEHNIERYPTLFSSTTSSEKVKKTPNQNRRCWKYNGRKKS